MIEIIIAVFTIGYLIVVFEHIIKINKAATALVTGVFCWTIYILFTNDKHNVVEQLTAHLGEISGILFFLLGAMIIVELIDAHYGFDVITEKINQRSKRKLLWIIGFLTFFLSAVLDNLATTIVIISLLRKLVKDENDRLSYVAVAVIAANAGGAWSPIGDVTTTMLWIGGQISSVNIVFKLILPCVISLATVLLFTTFQLKGQFKETENIDSKEKPLSKKLQTFVFVLGVAVLIFVPIFKAITHLPPYMGILIGLGILWIISELLHRNKDEKEKHIYSVTGALRKIDTSCILFFLGILLCIAALQSTGILLGLSNWMTKNIADENAILLSTGLLSSVAGNVPLIAASQGMYGLMQYPIDHSFWIFLAYCMGTGGSILIIGSAAGVAAMSMERIHFFWYLKKISLIALIGYFAGAITYIVQNHIISMIIKY